MQLPEFFYFLLALHFFLIKSCCILIQFVVAPPRQSSESYNKKYCIILCSIVSINSLSLQNPWTLKVIRKKIWQKKNVKSLKNRGIQVIACIIILTHSSENVFNPMRYTGYEWAKRTKFLLTVIYGSACWHSIRSKTFTKIGKMWDKMCDHFRTSWIT